MTDIKFSQLSEFGKDIVRACQKTYNFKTLFGQWIAGKKLTQADVIEQLQDIWEYGVAGSKFIYAWDLFELLKNAELAEYDEFAEIFKEWSAMGNSLDFLYPLGVAKSSGDFYRLLDKEQTENAHNFRAYLWSELAYNAIEKVADIADCA